VNKKLNRREIDQLLEKEPKIHTMKWPGDKDMVTLAKAVKAGESVVTFSDGRKFTIKDAERWDAVFVKPADGSFAPCGYFDRQRLKGVL
jgi:hypothetical protein